MPNSKYTVIINILNKIPEQTLDLFEKNIDIDKIILVHNNKNAYKNLGRHNIIQLERWKDYENQGTSVKYKIAASDLVSTEAVMFIDDTIQVDNKICKTLFSSWENNPHLVHGIDYMSIKYDILTKKYILTKEIDPFIILTNLCMVSKKNIMTALNYALDINDLMIQCQPKYSGLDICLSIIAACVKKTKDRLHMHFNYTHESTELANSLLYSTICTQCIKEYFNIDKTIFIEPKPTYEDLLVVVPFFNFANYNILIENISDMIYKLKAQHVNIVVMEAVLTNNVSQLYTVCCDIIITETDTIAFHKEGLFNKAFHLYKDYYNIFVLSDADIIFSSNNWPLTLTNIINTGVDIVQPYKTCHVTEKNGSISHTKTSYTSFRTENYKRGNWDRRKIAALRVNYHPGYVWAFSKKFLTKTNGLFPKCFSGSGDVMTLHLGEGFPVDKNAGARYDYLQPELSNFLLNGGGKFGSMDGEIYHLYHGSNTNRRYHKRHINIMDNNIDIGPNYFDVLLKDHLIHAINPLVNETNLQYFLNRNEDD